MSKRSRNAHLVPIVEDSCSQRVSRRVSIAEAHHLHDTSPEAYSWIDDSIPSLGLFVKTKTTVMRPQIGSTISTSELLVNAQLSGASPFRANEVKEKIAIYNTLCVDIQEYCPWPRPETMNFNKHAAVVGSCRPERAIDPDVRAAYLLRLGIYGKFV
jgi:hypothetical protein